MGKIENGSEQLNEQLLESIAKVLEVSSEELLHFHERPIFNSCNNSINSRYTTNSTINYNPIEKIEELYKLIIEEKDRLIQHLIEQNRKSQDN